MARALVSAAKPLLATTAFGLSRTKPDYAIKPYGAGWYYDTQMVHYPFHFFLSFSTLEPQKILKFEVNPIRQRSDGVLSWNLAIRYHGYLWSKPSSKGLLPG